MENILVDYLKDGMYISNSITKEIIKYISWEDLQHKLYEQELSDKILVSFSYSYGRYEDFYDSYLMDKEYWENLKPSLLGKDIYLGEIAGRHSEVIYNVTEDSINETTDIEKLINFKINYGISNCDADCLEYFEYDE